MKVWFWDFTVPTGQLSLFQIPEPSKEKASRIIQARTGFVNATGENPFNSVRRACNDQVQGFRSKVQVLLFLAP